MDENNLISKEYYKQYINLNDELNELFFNNNDNVKNIIFIFDPTSFENSKKTILFLEEKFNQTSHLEECVKASHNITNITTENNIKALIDFLLNTYNSNFLKIKEAFSSKNKNIILNGNFFCLFPASVFNKKLENNKININKKFESEIKSNKVYLCFKNTNGILDSDFFLKCLANEFNDQLFINFAPEINFQSFSMLMDRLGDGKTANILDSLYLCKYENEEELFSLLNTNSKNNSFKKISENIFSQYSNNLVQNTN